MGRPRMAILAALAAGGLLVSLAVAQGHRAGGTTEVVTKGHKNRGTGQDPNIKHRAEANDPSHLIPPPAEKGGPKARGRVCGVVVDNWTPWKVQFYLDGNLQGVAPAYGALSGVTFSGPTVVYARADMNDNTYITWGPETFQCANDTIYRWKIE
jgi:hypothetical protein